MVFFVFTSTYRVGWDQDGAASHLLVASISETNSSREAHSSQVSHSSIVPPLSLGFTLNLTVALLLNSKDPKAYVSSSDSVELRVERRSLDNVSRNICFERGVLPTTRVESSGENTSDLKHDSTTQLTLSYAK